MKRLSISAATLGYEGDALGSDFIIHIVYGDQDLFTRKINLQLKHGEEMDLSRHDLKWSIDYDDYLEDVLVPISVVAFESEDSGKFAATDFGHNAGAFFIEFRPDLHFPYQESFYLPVQVRGDYFADGAGRERHKVAELLFTFDIRVEWDGAPNEGPGKDLIEAYQSGKRDFQGAELQQAFMPGAELPGIDLSHANMLWADIQDTNFTDGIFENAILRAVSAERVIMRNARLDGANLAEGDFDESDFSGASLKKATLNSYFTGANLQGVDFSEADLHGVNFQEANLSQTVFRDARLEYVDFRNADLSGANFTDAVLGPINYDGAKLDGVVGLDVPSTNFDPVDPFEGKSQDFIEGYYEGYDLGYPYATEHPGDFDDNAWKITLGEHFPDASSDFAEGFREGFNESYQEGLAG